MQVTHKERGIRSIRCKETDRIAIDADIDTTDEMVLRVCQSLGLKTREDMFRFFDIDYRTLVVYTSAGIPFTRISDTEALNGWGVRFNSRLHSAVDHPLKECLSIDDAEQYPFLNPDDVDYDTIEKRVAGYETYCVYGGYWAPITYITQLLFGMDRYMMLFYDDPDLLDYVLDRITDISIEINKRIFSRLGDKMQIFFMGDDYGTQESLLTSMDFWRKHIRPRVQRLIELAKNSGYLVQFHSCGSVHQLIPDFIEMGVDALNPVQTGAAGMSLNELMEQYRGKIGFNGGIDTQELLPYGSAEDVRRAVQEAVAISGPGSGYAIAPSQTLLPEVPTENIIALYESAKALGRYQ